MNYSGNAQDILEGSLSKPKPGKESSPEKLQLLLQVIFPVRFGQEQDRPEASGRKPARLQGAECLYLRKITCCRVHAAILVLMNYERATNEQPGACVLFLLNRNIQTAPTGGTSQPEYLLNNNYFSIITALTL